MASTAHMFAAIDLGASNGRVVLGRLNRERLGLEIVHRFEHTARPRDGYLRWDWSRIIAEVRQGLGRAAELAGPALLQSVSACSWSQDFGLLGKDGRLIFEPVSYRDPRTEKILPSILQVIPADDLIRRVGSLVAAMLTLCQLRAMVAQEPEVLRQADTLLHIADLIHYDLCGARATDRTFATASQLLNLKSGQWDAELLDRLGIPHHFLPRVVRRVEPLGTIPASRAPHAALAGVSVLSTAGHDTSVATVVVPDGADMVFISSGTWSMLGCKTEDPVIPDQPFRTGCCTLGLAEGRWGFFNGIMGLWLVQECRRRWAEAGQRSEYADLMQAAQPHVPAQSLVDPDDPSFVAPPDMPEAVRQFCAQTGQPVPASAGEILAVIFTSLALNYRLAVENLERLTGRKFRHMVIIGGGSQNSLLCQLTADALELPVTAGPAEATAMGNLLLQAQAAGDLPNRQAVEQVVIDSCALTRYQPEARLEHALYERLAELKRKRVGG